MAGGDRSSADSALVAALAGGYTVAGAAARAHVSERTVYRRLDEAAFCQQITDARAELVGQAVGKLAAASPLAVSTLMELMELGNRASVRLSAARTVLEFGQRWRETEELAERVRVLEAATLTPVRQAR